MEVIQLDNLNGHEFEDFMVRVFRKLGYKRVRKTPKSNDMGRDIIMEDNSGNIIFVECKHQAKVGRSVIQKLYGSIQYEAKKRYKKNIKGIVVTTGRFTSNAIKYAKGCKIELIDIEKLNEICKKYNIVVINGKVHITTNKCFKIMSKDMAHSIISEDFKKIYGHERFNYEIKSELKLYPFIFVDYHVDSITKTSVGIIDHYVKSGTLAIDGGKLSVVHNDSSSFLINNYNETIIPKIYEQNKIPLTVTEEKIEKMAIDEIIRQSTHFVHYVGKNNVSYSKKCLPKKKDITINKIDAVYVPYWRVSIKLKTNKKDVNKKYSQEFYSSGNRYFIILNDLNICRFDYRKHDYDDLVVCNNCGSIACKKHSKIDDWDNTTPVCIEHAKEFKLFFRKKYFSSMRNLNKYKEAWESKNIFEKLIEDGVAMILLILILLLMSTAIYNTIMV